MRTRFWLWMAVASTATLSCVHAPTFAATAHPGGDGISLAVTLGTDVSEGACGTDTTLQATVGDPINFCYVVTNHSTTTLNFHSLADDVNGPIFTSLPVTLAPGASYQYNRVITAATSQSPVATWTSYDIHPDYTYATTNADPDRVFADGFDVAGGTPGYAFVEIGATGTDLELFDDGSASVSLGFPFTFYGETSDQIVVGNNGGILFGVPDGFVSPRNLPLPESHLGAAILPYWTDIYESVGDGSVFVQSFGTAPNRSFVVEWKDLPVMIGGFTDGATWEAIFYEGSNRIVFQYADTIVDDPARDNGITTTIGIQQGDDDHFVQYSYLEASVSDGTAILFEPSHPLTVSATQQVALDVGAPIIGVDPVSFDKTVAAGATTTDTLTIANTGNRDLTWNIGEVGARSHFPPVSRFALPMGDPSKTSIGARPSSPHKTLDTEHANPLAGLVPAFADDTISTTIVGFDAASPDTLTPIGGPNGLSFFAGDFVGEDFSTLYAIDFRTFDLYKVDTATGALTRVDVAEVPPGASALAWNGMSWDASTHTMFATTSGGRTSESFLETIDPATAATTLVGTITGVGDPVDGTAIIDLAVDSAGLMYGVEIITDTLVAIDKATGEATTIGSIGFDANFAADLDFDDYTGTLYFVSYDNGTGLEGLYTLNTATGAATLVSPIGADPSATQIDAMAIARLGGVCAYPGDVPWLDFDTTRGSTTPGSTTPITVTFDATDLAAGTYSADICIYNNDLTNKRLAVPVALTVQ
jgi:hypothetical protein